MDYTGILKRAWSVTWRYKILWLFGLFAGAGGGGSGGGGGGGRTGTDLGGRDMGFDRLQYTRFVDTVERYLPVIILAVLFLIAVGLLFWIVSVAARGGLIHLVDEAEEGRPVRASDGWSAGFHHWGRLFGVGFLSSLPVIAVLIVLLIVGAIGGIGLWSAAEGGGRPGAGGAVLALSGLCLFGVIAVAALLFFGVVFGIVRELALRYVVLEERRVMDALKQGWRDLWGRRGAFMMFLITVGTGIVYAIIVGIIAVVLMVPGILMAVGADIPAGWALVAFAVLLLFIPAAIYGTFYHSMWTIFFRRMTGREQMHVAPSGSPLPPYGAPAPPDSRPWSSDGPEPPPEEPPVPPAGTPPPSLSGGADV